MNAFAVFVVNEHLMELRDEAAQRRALQGPKPSFGRRVAAAAARVKAAVSTAPDESYSVLPKLDGYPYRG
jgi:hypothetical protein